MLFLDVSNNVLTATHFVTSGTSSAGWVSTIADSTFTKRNGSVTVPVGAVKMRCALVSGGDPSITGVMVIDDLSVAVIPVSAVVPPTILAGNFFPNPTFEVGVNMDNPSTAAPAGNWIRGGNDGTINLVITNNWVSPIHSLALVDNSLGYGEWYNFYTLGTNAATPGNVLDVQFFQLYNTTNGSMRVSFAFLDSSSFELANTDFNSPTLPGMSGPPYYGGGPSPGWTGIIATSPFERVSGRLLVPAGTVKLRVNFASGGASDVTGIMVIDDLSVRLSKPVITSINAAAGSNTIAWLSMPSKLYTVQFATNLSSPAFWSSLVTGLAGDASLSNTNVDTVTHAGKTGFYRVLQQ